MYGDWIALDESHKFPLSQEMYSFKGHISVDLLAIMHNEIAICSARMFRSSSEMPETFLHTQLELSQANIS